MDPVRAAFEMMREQLRAPPGFEVGEYQGELTEEDRAHEEYLYKRSVLEVIRKLDEKWAAATVDRG